MSQSSASSSSDSLRTLLCVIAGALAVASAFFIYQAFFQPKETSPVTATHTKTFPLGENFIVADPNVHTFLLKPSDCRADLEGTRLAKQGDICTITIDRVRYPSIQVLGGRCADIDGTSPQNSPTQLVLSVRGAKSFAFTLSSAKWVRSISSKGEEPVTIQGIGNEGDYKVVPCDTLPADPN